MRCLHQPLGLFFQAGSAGGGVQRGLELGNIGGHNAGIDGDSGVVGQQERSAGKSRRFQLAAQGGKFLLETVAACGRLDFGPEEFKERFAGMRLLGMEGKIGQEQTGAARPKARYLLLSASHPQPAEKFDAPLLRHHSRCSPRSLNA